MKVRQHTAAACGICGLPIVFAAATVGSVGCDSRRLVDAAATILVLVAMLSPFACAGEPFKTKLVFSDFHVNFCFKFLVRSPGLEPGTKRL